MKWLILLFLAIPLASCGIERPPEIRNTGLGDRCADYLRMSYPGIQAVVNLKHTDVATTTGGTLGLMIVDVEGIRPDIPATGGFLANEIAARCRFENGILTQFRWTKGPLR